MTAPPLTNARRLALGGLCLLAALAAAVSASAAEEYRRVPLPSLGARVAVDLSLGEFVVQKVRVSAGSDEAGQPAYVIEAIVANPGAVALDPDFVVSLWAGEDRLGEAAFAGGANSVPPGAARTLVQRAPMTSAARPDAVAIRLPAQDWAEWRGPDRNGVAPYSPSLATAWPAGGPRKLWDNHDFPLAPAQYAGGHSCPAIANGRVYLYIHDVGVPRDTMACLDLQTGKTLWRQDVPGQKTWHGGSGTPCVVGDRVYVAGARLAYCLDAATGAILWSRDLKAPPADGQEISSSFALTGKAAIVMAGPTLGLDPATGQTLWQAPSTGGYAMVMTSLVPWSHAGRTYGIQVGVDRLTCLDPADGKVIWDVADGKVWGGTSPSPAIVGDYMAVYFHGQLEAYHLTTTAPERLWVAPYLEEYASPIIWRGRVYVIGPHEKGQPVTVRCRELLTGNMVWDTKINAPEYGSPVLADGKVLLLTDKGSRLRMMDAVTGEMLGGAYVGAQLWSSPSITEGKLLVRVPDGVACFDLTAGANPVTPVTATDHHLELVEATTNVCGYDVARDDANIVGGLLTLGGKTYLRGIGTHSPCELVFPLAGKYRWLTCHAGIGDHVTETGSVTIEVWLDGRKAYESALLRAGEKPVYISLAVDGVKEFRLVGTDGGDGHGWDNINFGDLRVSAGATPPPEE